MVTKCHPVLAAGRLAVQAKGGGIEVENVSQQTEPLCPDEAALVK